VVSFDTNYGGRRFVHNVGIRRPHAVDHNRGRRGLRFLLGRKVFTKEARFASGKKRRESD
jgi:hypothetical protein